MIFVASTQRVLMLPLFTDFFIHINSVGLKSWRIITLRCKLTVPTTTVQAHGPHNDIKTSVCACVAFSSWSPGWRGCGPGWPGWSCPCTASDAGWSPPGASERPPAERERCIRGAVVTDISITWRRRRADLVPGRVVDLGRQALGLGVAGEQVLGLVQTQAEDLSVQVVVLIPQLVVLLQEENKERERLLSGGGWRTEVQQQELFKEIQVYLNAML